MTFKGRQINLDLWKAIKPLRELNNRESLHRICSSYWRLSLLWVLKFGVFVTMVSRYLALSRMNDLVSTEMLFFFNEKGFLHLCLFVVLVPGAQIHSALAWQQLCQPCTGCGCTGVGWPQEEVSCQMLRDRGDSSPGVL